MADILSRPNLSLLKELRLVLAAAINVSLLTERSR
jgi:hypothetical protein